LAGLIFTAYQVSIPDRDLGVFPPPMFETVGVFGFQGSFVGI